jgi:hypothetical protein
MFLKKHCCNLQSVLKQYRLLLFFKIIITKISFGVYNYSMEFAFALENTGRTYFKIIFNCIHSHLTL